MAVADKYVSLILSGTGDVPNPNAVDRLRLRGRLRAPAARALVDIPDIDPSDRAQSHGYRRRSSIYTTVNHFRV